MLSSLCVNVSYNFGEMGVRKVAGRWLVQIIDVDAID